MTDSPASIQADGAPPDAAAARRSPRASLESLSKLWPFVWPYRWHLFVAFGLLSISSAALLVVPLSFKDLIDHGFAGDPRMRWHFAALVVIAWGWAAATAGRYYQVTWLGERVTADLRNAVYRQMLRQAPEFFERTRTGEVLSRLTGDTTLVQTVVGSSVSMGLRSAFQFVGAIIMLAITSPTLFAITIVLLLAVVLPIIWMARLVRRLSRESQDRIADSSAVASEYLNAIATVQANNQEETENRRFAATVERSFATAIRRTSMRALMTAGVIAGVFTAIVFVLWLGAEAVAGGRMTGGDLASFVLYAALVAGAVGVLAEVWGDVSRAAGATERLMELLAAEPTIKAPARPKALPVSRQARVAFDKVAFRYPARPAVAAVDGVSFELNEGETVALVGPSGAGKTTLFQLLQRFYDVEAGAVRFHGIDVRELDPADLRARIAVVSQEPVIFSGDLLDNIRYGRPDAGEDEVRAAARAAHVDEFVERLPDGYRTYLGERGVRLSGGQRQRVAIARAILRNPPLLLLDEATNSLDAESEALVQAGLDKAMQGRTTLVIAHRLATVHKADRILVMEQGRLVEQGTASELVRLGGLYARLASLQFAA